MANLAGPLRGLISAQEWQDRRSDLLTDPGSMLDTLRRVAGLPVRGRIECVE